MTDKNDPLKTTKFQSSLIYVTLALAALTFVGALYIAARCYLPYNFTDALDASEQKILWLFIVLPSIMIPIALWLSNHINRKLSWISVIAVFVGCGFFVSVPFIYTLDSARDISYITSSFAFFLVSAVASCLIWDLCGGRHAPKIWALIGSAICIVMQGVLTAFAFNYIVILNFLGRTVLCFLMPIFCMACFVTVLVDAFTGTFSRFSIGCAYFTLAYGTLCTSFSQMNQRVLLIIFAVLAAITVISGVFDIIKTIFTKEDIR